MVEARERLKKLSLDCLVVDEGSIKDSAHETNRASYRLSESKRQREKERAQGQGFVNTIK